MLCSPHHEIFKDISYHFKFNPNIQFRIPEFKTTSIVSPGHVAISKLSVIIHYSKMYSKIIHVTIVTLPITKVHSIKMFIIKKCSSSNAELPGTSGFRTSVIRFRTSCLQGFFHLIRTSGNINTRIGDRI